MQSFSSDRAPGYRFPKAVIGYAVYLYHRFTLSVLARAAPLRMLGRYRDVQELLLTCGIEVSHETIRIWCKKFGPCFAQRLQRREVQRGERWHLDEMHIVLGGQAHWLWRAVDEHGAVLDILLQERRDTKAAKRFFHVLLDEYDAPEVIVTDQLGSYGAALGDLPELSGVEHQSVLASDRKNNVIEQSHCPTREQERQQRGFRRVGRAQDFLETHARVSN